MTATSAKLPFLGYILPHFHRKDLAVIFRPGLISHPQHETSPQEYELSQRVLEFLIAQQDWFMLEISPPSPGEPGVLLDSGARNASRHQTDNNNNGGISSESGGEVPSSPGWNVNPDAGPSTPRQRTGSMPVWSSTLPSTHPSPPNQQINTQGSHNFGQLTEQITPVSSVPPSPTTPHFERSKASPVLSGIIPEAITSGVQVQGIQHQRRPSNLVYQMNRPRSRSPTRTGTPAGSLPSEVEELMVIPSVASIKSAEEEDPAASFVPGGGGWKIVERSVGGSTREARKRLGGLQYGSGGGFMAIGTTRKDKDRKDSLKEEEEMIKAMRRRSTMEKSGNYLSLMSVYKASLMPIRFSRLFVSALVPHAKITIIEENPSTPELTSGGGSGEKTGIQRRRTLPSRRKESVLLAEDLAASGGASTDKENEKEGFSLWSYKKDRDKEKPEKRVLKKQRRASGQVNSMASTSAHASASGGSAGGGGASHSGVSTPVIAPSVQSNRMLGPSSLGTQTGRENQPSGGSLSKHGS